MGKMKLNIPQRVIDATPVFVTAPTVRNGITLIQRLLNSSGQIIIYGENIHLMSVIPNTLASVFRFYHEGVEKVKKARQEFLAGDRDGWKSDLFPDLDLYVKVTLENAYRIVALYQKCSEEYGYQRWGIKNPIGNAEMVGTIKGFLPNVRFIYIYRNLYDVARSAKARKFAKTLGDFQDLAQRWQNNLLPMLQRQGPGGYVLVIKYEELIENPERDIRRIEQFSQIEGIDRKIMARKLNTFIGQNQDGFSPTGYIPPAQLSEEEAAVLTAGASKALSLTGYVDSPAGARNIRMASS